MLDAGNVAKGTTPYDRNKLGYIVDAMWAMGYDAMNLGEREAALGRADLRKLAASGRVPMVSCNVLDAVSGAPVVAPYRIQKVGAATVAIVGVTDADGPVVGPGLVIVPPEEALARVLPEVRSRCNVVIVLAAVDGARMDALAARFRDIDCLLGGNVGTSWPGAYAVGHTALFAVGDEGREVARLRAFWSQKEGFRITAARTILLDPQVADHPSIMQVVRAWKSGLRTAPGMRSITTVAHTGSARFVGSGACQACHASAYQAWVESRHAHAFASLQRRGSQDDPECLRCHTTGYGSEDGFGGARAAPGLAVVGCEMCHGRGSQHVTNRGGRLPTADRRTCTACHDRENSPDFQFETFFPRIRHGR